jgi:hypothetical protein
MALTCRWGSRPRHHKRKLAISFGPPKRRAAEMYVRVVNSIQTLLSLLRMKAKGVVVGASPNSNFRENIHCVGQFLQLSLRRHFYQAECLATEPEQ